MDKSAITMTADDDWWLERVTMDGEQRYPERIRVGSLERPRVYVPERTCDAVRTERPCADAASGWETVFECSECGEVVSWDDGYDPETDLPSYCPRCGARIVVMSDS